MKIAAIVPVLNEERSIDDCLGALTDAADEVIVADGGSRDATLQRALRAGARVVETARGRAAQMNAGAALAQADVLVFVHADTRMPAGWREAVAGALARGHQWGRFDVRLDDDGLLLRLIARMMNWRSRLTGICTGDQSIFVSSAAWHRLGGYAAIPLMEDIDLSARLRRGEGAPACLTARVLVSARRWRSRGVVRTMALMWILRFLYSVGVPPAALHRLYYGKGR